jgi:hypothetical protein
MVVGWVGPVGVGLQQDCGLPERMALHRVLLLLLLLLLLHCALLTLQTMRRVLMLYLPPKISWLDW